MFAVVPCQWWRIIGSYSGLTRENIKKLSLAHFSGKTS
ncbi:hypothetical protein ECE128010_2456 [Escherichia coli E128010]|nr:hypothetical protein ECE128010_2456 [Escherichia coli E128010]